MLTYEVADNLLDCFDGKDVACNDLIRDVKQYGAMEVHGMFVATMKARGWRDGARDKTDKELKTSPHIRGWKLLVDSQRWVYERIKAGSLKEGKMTNGDYGFDYEGEREKAIAKIKEQRAKSDATTSNQEAEDGGAE